jgi:hypothetical protein
MFSLSNNKIESDIFRETGCRGQAEKRTAQNFMQPLSLNGIIFEILIFNYSEPLIFDQINRVITLNDDFQYSLGNVKVKSNYG